MTHGKRGKLGKLKVNDHLFSSLFIFVSILFYLPALWARKALSGDNYSPTKYLGYYLYILACFAVHLNYLENNYIPFVGVKGNPIMAGASLLVMFAYFFTSPVPWKRKGWFSRVPMPVVLPCPSPDRRKTYQRRVLAKWEKRPVKNFIVYVVITVVLILFWLEPLQDWLARPDTVIPKFNGEAFGPNGVISYIFILLAFMNYLPSLWARFALSGEGFLVEKSTAALVYNIFCAIFHQEFLNDGKFIFLDAIDNSMVGWVSFCMIILHAEAVAYPWRRRILLWKVV